jgi:hypothetical protein
MLDPCSLSSALDKLFNFSFSFFRSCFLVFRFLVFRFLVICYLAIFLTRPRIYNGLEYLK